MQIPLAEIAPNFLRKPSQILGGAAGETWDHEVSYSVPHSTDDTFYDRRTYHVCTELLIYGFGSLIMEDLTTTSSMDRGSIESVMIECMMNEVRQLIKTVMHGMRKSAKEVPHSFWLAVTQRGWLVEESFSSRPISPRATPYRKIDGIGATIS